MKFFLHFAVHAGVIASRYSTTVTSVRGARRGPSSEARSRLRRFTTSFWGPMFIDSAPVEVTTDSLVDLDAAGGRQARCRGDDECSWPRGLVNDLDLAGLGDGAHRLWIQSILSLLEQELRFPLVLVSIVLSACRSAILRPVDRRAFALEAQSAKLCSAFVQHMGGMQQRLTGYKADVQARAAHVSAAFERRRLRPSWGQRIADT